MTIVMVFLGMFAVMLLIGLMGVLFVTSQQRETSHSSLHVNIKSIERQVGQIFKQLN